MKNDKNFTGVMAQLVCATRRTALAFSIAAIPATAWAGSCTNCIGDISGRIYFLGRTSDLKHSVWLSKVSPGEFDVSSAMTNQPYDRWTQKRPGLHVTVSPEQAEWGGTHILYNYENAQTSINDRRFVDSANQKPGRITFPPNFQRPSLPPGLAPGLRPPGGGDNGDNGHHHGGGNSGNGGGNTGGGNGGGDNGHHHGGGNSGNGGGNGGGTVSPGTPPQGMMPTLPGGVQPPLGTLPPQGITPSLPGGVKPPVGTLPPQGITPTLPGGVKPPVGTLPPQGITPSLPGGVKPPVGTLPPQGITPTLPGGVKPPVGTLPPQGITPSLPGGVKPPVGTLPPQGITPTLPGGVKPPVGTLPPQGITPTLPGGVKPPVGTLPPQGITPTLPGGVKPPVGTLPPQGITPSLPGGVKPPVGTLPPQGITPTLPGGVKPPVGTLPPQGITPSLPGGVKPPVGTLPPQGITPTLPGGVKPPVGTLPPQGIKPLPGVIPPSQNVRLPEGGSQIAQLPGAAATDQADRMRGYTEGAQRYAVPCPISPDDRAAAAEGVQRPLDCVRTDERERIERNLSGTQALPETPGREVAPDSVWNAWVDNNYTKISDERYGLDLDGHSYSLTVGVDRRLDNGVVLGGLIGMQNSRSEQFEGDMKLKSNGFNIGPYAAYQYADDWVADASLSYGRTDNEQRILMFSGDYTSTQWSASLNTTGQYRYGETYVRPKLSLYYGHNSSGAYQMNGTVLGRDWAFDNDGSSSNYGYLQFGSEFNRTFEGKDGLRYMPYADASIKYEFERANDGMVMTGDLGSVKTGPFSGSAHLGIRALWSTATMLEASIGYESIGQNDLDVWSGRIYLSHAF